MRGCSLTLCLFGLVVIASPVQATNVTGTVLWTDNVDVTHPSRGVRIEVFRTHTDGTPHEHLGTTTTDRDGTFSFSTGLSLGTGDAWQVFAYAEHDGARINSTGTSTGGAYAIFSPGSSSAALPTMTADKLSANGRAFAVADALYSSWYYGTRVTTGVTKRSVQFPTASTGFDPDTNKIMIEDAKWDKWDSITHEYGHYLSTIDDTDSQPAGFTHGFGASNIPTRGKEIGCQLAWGEGLPTYHGIAAQRMNMADQKTPITAPYVGDTYYGFSTESVGIETDFGSAIPHGEGDELAVARILWDMADSGDDEDWDHWSSTEAGLYSTIDSITPAIDRLDQLWDHYAAITPDVGMAALGEIFEQNSVSPTPWGFPIDMTLASTAAPPEFKWFAGNNNANDDFSILFFNELFTARVGGGIDVGSDLSYTPAPTEWDDLQDYVALHGDTTFKWVITGADQDGYGGADITGDYWSGARSFTMLAPVPTPGTLALAGACAAAGVRRQRTWITPCPRPT